MANHHSSHSYAFLWLATNFATNNFTAALQGRYFRNMMSQGQQALGNFSLLHTLLEQNLVTNQRYASPQLTQMVVPLTTYALASGSLCFFGNNRRETTLLSSQNDTVTCCILNTQCAESTYHQDFARSKTYCPPCCAKQ